MIITIDGPAGSGKSTVSRSVAKKLQLTYLDTGAMYRAVALQAKRDGVDCKDGKKLQRLCTNLDLRFQFDGEAFRLFLGDEDVTSAIRSPEMDMLSSNVSAAREVREAMIGLQREIGKKGGLVAEGRDMGTVVFPEAAHKFYLTASQEVRAARRYRERVSRGENPSKEKVVAELNRRDEQDSTRAIAPLKPAKDAKLIDSTTSNQDRVVEEIIQWIEKVNP